MSDHLERLRAWRVFAEQNRPGYDHMRDISYEKARVCNADLDAALDELEQLRADNAALLDGNQRLQTMNEGLRQLAVEAREAANGWHQATIDLYSGREEAAPQQPERSTCCGGAHAGWIHAADCANPQQPDHVTICGFPGCLHPSHQPECGADADGAR